MKQEARNISLTGLMGSGKSSVGRTIARLLKYKFIDTDFIIEKEEGKSIQDIFKIKGEGYFRQQEKKVIARYAKENGLVLSLGGGAIIDEENRQLLKSTGTLVTLIATPEELMDRVKRRRHRPLLNDENPLTVLQRLWEERKEAYLDSDMQVNTSDKDVEEIAYEVIQNLNLKRVTTQQLKVNIPRETSKYNIYFKKLREINLSDLQMGQQVLVVTQKDIAEYYLAELKEVLSKNYKVNTLIIENGEEAKNLFTYQVILQKCLGLKFERKDALIALGGGVVGDLVGFAASTYYRGINYVQIPTTLLSMIDSSVGGKTGINVPEGKNLIGSFYQPHMVHIDVDKLKSLPDSEFKSGLGEMVKYALLGSRWDTLLGESFFSFLSRNAQKILAKDNDILCDAIEHCLRIKINVVAEDEKEKGLRMHLNLGHTFGHAIEDVTEYKRYSHGEAVAIGTVCACYLAESMKLLKKTDTQRVIQLMEDLKLVYTLPKDINVTALLESFKYDKKVADGKVNFVLPKGKIGKVELVSNIDMSLVKDAMKRNMASGN